jgi:hypothetical protein
VRPLFTGYSEALSLLGRLARLGWTRIGSPGIFGLSITKALFRAAKAQVAGERKWGSYRANLGLRFARHLRWGAVTIRPR